MSFNTDLKRGQYYEQKAIIILKANNFSDLTQSEGKNSDYDIKGFYEDKPTTIEVKYNKKADYLHCFCIEYSKTDGTPSGLSISKSTYYMLFSYTKYYLIETQKLRNVINEYITDKLKKQGIINPTKNNIMSYIFNNRKLEYNYICLFIPIKHIIKQCLITAEHGHINPYKTTFTNSLFKRI